MSETPDRPALGAERDTPKPAPEQGLAPCPEGRTDYETCFAPFRYCPVKGCGRAEGDVQLLVAGDPTVAVPPTRDDLIRNLLGIARKRAESASATKPLDVAAWPVIHRHYTDADTCEHGERLHVGWLELGQEAENAQQMLDIADIPDGDPQGRGDVDWRTAEAVLQLTDARERLGRIADNHSQERGDGGMVGSFCVECGHLWPCPTYRFANGDADTLDPWCDEDELPLGGGS